MSSYAGDTIDRPSNSDATGLDRIEESTETINRGMSNPFVWLLLIGSIVGVPFTGGLSVGLMVVALLIMTAGGKANVQAIQPTTADLAAPGLGCIRIMGALGVLIIMVIVICLFGLLLWANANGLAN